MKKYSKLVSLLLVGAMVIGMAFTAVAATNGSPSTPADKAAKVRVIVYNSAKIAAGGGSIAAVTDETVLASAYDQITSVAQYANNTLRAKNGGNPVYVYKTLLFDVQGVKSGEVSLQLYSDGKFDVEQAKGKLAVVDHYVNGQWVRQKDANGNDMLSKIDSQGRLTITMPSYSPIMVSVLNVESLEGMPTLNYNPNPKQVLTTSNSKSPKMGE